MAKEAAIARLCKGRYSKLFAIYESLYLNGILTSPSTSNCLSLSLSASHLKISQVPGRPPPPHGVEVGGGDLPVEQDRAVEIGGDELGHLSVLLGFPGAGTAVARGGRGRREGVPGGPVGARGAARRHPRKPLQAPRMPMANMPMMIHRALIFLLSRYMHAKVRPSAAAPGSRLSAENLLLPRHNRKKSRCSFQIVSAI